MTAKLAVHDTKTVAFFQEGNDSMVQEKYLLAKKHNFSQLKAYLTFRDGFSSQEVDMALEQYCRFMALMVAYPNVCIPSSNLIDPIWHAHVLNTRDYSEFCVSLQGSFIHHAPYISDSQQKALARSYHHTKTLYVLHFGELNEKYWGSATTAECWNDDDLVRH